MTRKLLTALAALAAALALSSAASAADGGIDWRAEVAPAADFRPLLDQARADGTVRTIVGLQALWAPDARLSQGERTRQQEEQGRLRGELLATLDRGTYRVTRTFERLPLVAIELDPAGVDALQRGGRAAKVQEDAENELYLDGTTRIVEATETTALGFTGTGHRVAILDSGVDENHPFFAGRIDVAEQRCFTSNDCPSVPVGPGAAAPCTYTPISLICRHGTHVAGIAAGANGVSAGVEFDGVAPGARILPIKVASKKFGSPQCFPDPWCPTVWTADVLAGLDWVHALGDTDAVNLSLGGGTFNAPCLAEFGYIVAVAQLLADGTAVVAASGNNSSKNGIGRPACVPGVISVGRTNDDDTIAGSSQSTPQLSLLAPGSNVRSSLDPASFGIMSGTSMAAPHVTGAIAVLREKAPAATVAQLLTALQQTGLPRTDTNGVTTPRIRLLSALVRFGETGFGTDYGAVLPGGQLWSDGASARKMPAAPSSITISGIPAGHVVESARLYVMTAGAADADQTVAFDGLSFGMKLLGGARPSCDLSTTGAVRVYRATVTQSVTGNGTYTVNGVVPNGVGVSLVVVTRNPAAGSPIRHVQVRAGAMTAQPAGTMMHPFNVLVTPSSADFHVGIGDGDATSEGPMRLGGLWAFAANAFSGSDGGDWDDRTAALSAGPLYGPFHVVGNLLLNSIQTQNDCLSWAYAGLSYPLS